MVINFRRKNRNVLFYDIKALSDFEFKTLMLELGKNKLVKLQKEMEEQTTKLVMTLNNDNG